MNQAHAMWYLTRGTGIVALVLVTMSVLAGISASLRAGGVRTPRFVVAGLHRNLSLMTVAFIVVHVVTTLLDAYAPIRLVDAVVPFISAYRPIWLGLGALAFDIILALVITSLVRVRIGLRTWRGIHWFAYACFPIAVVHALGTGTDATQGWLQAVALVCVAAVVAGVLMRLWQVRPERLAGPTGRGPGLVWRIPTRRPALRVLGTVAVLAVPVLTAMWAIAGPLAPRWAARAGTPVPRATPANSLAALAAQQAALEQQRLNQIHAASLRVTAQTKEVRAAIAAVVAASKPVALPTQSVSASASGGSGYSSGGSGYSAPSAPAPVAAAPAAAPVVATGGS